MTIRYQVGLVDPDRHEFEVKMRLTIPKEGSVELSLPAWIPGSYMIRDFARNIVEISASDALGAQLPLHKKDKQTWVLRGDAAKATLVYRVYAYDLSVRSAYFDNTRAYFNGTSLFLRPAGEDEAMYDVVIQRGEHECTGKWRVATGMPAVDVDADGFGLYRCEGYEALIDYPFEIAQMTCAGFWVADVRHEMAFVDAAGIDAERIARDMEPICAEHVAMFGELPVESYLFMTLATSGGYGGLEHRNSTSLVCKRSDLPYPNSGDVEKGYRTFLALCSHEYFHLWNVKRIRPKVFAETGLQSEVHTELLWAFEGVTSYYDELALPRAGVVDADAYLDMLAPSLTRYYRTQGRRRQTVAESSFDAWTKFYKQDENAANAIVSYYTKGALVAFGLDLLIRTQTDDSLSLDDLMRRLWQRYGKRNIGVPERGIEKEIEGLTGVSAEQFFRSYVYGKDELPLAEWFAAFGVGLARRPAKNSEDVGTFVCGDTQPQTLVNALQAVVTVKEGLLSVVSVTNGGSTQMAGLAAGDLLLAVDGERCTQANLSQLLNRKAAGDTVELSYFRRDLLKQTQLTLQPDESNTCDMYWLDEATLSAKVLARKAAWLSSSHKG